MAKKIEIEYRARFPKNKYDSLLRVLNANAQFLGNDDKDVYFFALPNKLLKIVNNISKNKVEVVLKLNRIGKGSHFEEIDIPIEKENLKKWIVLFKQFNTLKMIRSFQKRKNFLYKGVEISLKYSKNWGYHAELEIVINNIKKKKQTTQRIKDVAKELNIKLMSEKELKEFVKRFQSKK